MSATEDGALAAGFAAALACFFLLLILSPMVGPFVMRGALASCRA